MKKILNVSSVLAFNCLVLLLLHGCDSPPGIYDQNRDYYLPYMYNSDSFVVQSNNGPLSHKNIYAIDFVMDEGTPITASRSGEVLGIQEDCPDIACPVTRDCCGNFVRILHEDGTQATYYHLMPNGACVEAGDIVERGDIIGMSGNTGISIMPHLHFQVKQPNSGSLLETIEVTFADVYGDGIPMMGWIYTSRNDIGDNFCDTDL